LAPHSNAGYNRNVNSDSQTIRVKVLFFGRLKEIISLAEDSAELPDHAVVEQLFASYSARYPELAKYRSSLIATCNEEFVAWDTQLCTGDEVGFLPPVSGG
jgi:molybdopterin converting factor subunit 1